MEIKIITPKEKAQELIQDFKRFAYYPQTKDDDVFVEKLNANAKHCATICVDEIIKVIKHTQPEAYWSDGEIPYWGKVQLEIQKL
jgi:hypothetical protein